MTMKPLDTDNHLYVALMMMCLFGYTNSLELTLNPNGTWTEGSPVSITCKMTSYPDQMTWRYNSTVVAACILTVCTTHETDLGRFQFGFDTANAKFTFIISEVRKKYNGLTFACYENSQFVAHVAVVQGSGENQTGNNDERQAALIIGITIVVQIVIISAAFLFRVLWYKCRKNKHNQQTKGIKIDKNNVFRNPHVLDLRQIEQNLKLLKEERRDEPVTATDMMDVFGFTSSSQTAQS